MDAETTNDAPESAVEETERPHDVFSPKLNLKSKAIHNHLRDMNFFKLIIEFIDFAGDVSGELDGINITSEGGVLRPAKINPAGLTIDPTACGYTVRGRTPADHPDVEFDYFPDGKNQAGKVVVSREGCLPVEATFEFTPPSLHWLFDVTESLVWAFFIAMLIRLFLFQTFYIPSGSMQPTLYENDRIVANKLIYKLRQPRPGEVAIFKVYSYTSEERLKESTPKQRLGLGRASFEKDSSLGDRYILRDYIKRVAALPGDKLEIRDHELIVNGDVVDEPWITDTSYDFNYDFGPVVVPEGHLFVIGDNHRNSQDSHKLGFLPIENVVGKAMFVFFPMEHLKMIK